MVAVDVGRGGGSAQSCPGLSGHLKEDKMPGSWRLTNDPTVGEEHGGRTHMKVAEDSLRAF